MTSLPILSPSIQSPANIACVTDPAPKVIFAEPSNDVPLIVLAVVSVAADPVVFWFNVPTVKSIVLSAS